MFLLFTLGRETHTPQRDWNWFLAQFTPKMKQALSNEAYRIVRNKDDMDDVMQEAMLIGATKCGQLRDETKLFQWMFKIVRREAYNHLNKSSPLKLLAKIHDVFYAPSMHPEELVISKEDNEVLHGVINTLDEQTKQLVLLNTTTDMSLKEIAIQLGMNYNTARSKYQRALDTLRQRMEDEYEEKTH